MSETYCQFVRAGRAGKLLTDYHNEEYGVPVRDESVLFERLTLETFQAGLSWEIVLKKRSGLFEAFKQFNADQVAAFGPDEIETVVQNPRVIRNRRKIEAAVYNAKAIIQMREQFGGFDRWLDLQIQNEQEDWVSAFRSRFKFMGGEVVGEFLISLGIIPGSHDADCEVGQRQPFGKWKPL